MSLKGNKKIKSYKGMNDTFVAFIFSSGSIK